MLLVRFDCASVAVPGLRSPADVDMIALRLLSL
ncbi:MAG: hypothetical protein JWN04_6583 [Myxococcaceae bacterium]|nr:hypothetical protein [Myxococcaceae bacterium]